MSTLIIELKRALREKNFWIALLVLIILSIIMPMPNFMPVKMKYIYSLDNGLLSEFSGIVAWKNFLDTRIMTAFIPLLPVLVYSHSMVDDIENKFINNIISKIGFRKYFKSKLFASMILGGGLYFFASLISYFISCLIYGNGTAVLHNTFTIMGFKFDFAYEISYVLFVSFLLFFMGMIFASFGFCISLFTNNKMLIYGVPVLALRAYEDIAYHTSMILSMITNHNYSGLYMKYSIFVSLGSYDDGTFIINILLLFVISTNLIYFKFGQMKKVYEEL